MEKNIFVYLIIAIVLVPSTLISQDGLIVGIKGGVGLSRFLSLQDSPGNGKPIKHYYPIGYSFGLYSEYRLSDLFSMKSELLYQSNSAKINIYTFYEGIRDQEVTTNHLVIPVLFKLHASWLWETYFLAGPSFLYLFSAKYTYYDHIYSDERGHREITNDIPRISTAVEFGFGKDVELCDSELALEARAQLGLTQYRYENVFPRIGKWNNAGLVFSINYRIK